MNKIRLTESQLHRVIKESVKKVLKEEHEQNERTKFLPIAHFLWNFTTEIVGGDLRVPMIDEDGTFTCLACSGNVSVAVIIEVGGVAYLDGYKITDSNPSSLAQKIVDTLITDYFNADDDYDYGDVCDDDY